MLSLKTQPMVVVEFSLEERPVVRVLASSFEDERRLAAWVGRSWPRVVAEVEQWTMPGASEMAA